MYAALLSLLLAACGSADGESRPGIWVIVDAEPSLAAELDRLRIQTDRGSATVWLREPPTGEERRELPVVLDLEMDETRRRDVLRVRGFEGTVQRVERVAELAFAEGKRLVLKIVLSQACARTSCRAEQGLTCIDCRGQCEASKVNTADLQEVSLSAQPLAVYQAPSCRAAGDAGPLDVLAADTGVGSGHDGGDDVGDGGARLPDGGDSFDAAADGGANERGDAGVDAGDVLPGDPLLEGCVLLLHMDEPEWTGAADEVRDASGANNHGRSRSGATTTAQGKFGRAGQFGGLGYVEVLDAPALRASSALTVSAWFNMDDLPGTRWPGVVAKRNAYLDGSAFALYLTPTNTIEVDVATEDNRFGSNATFEADRWYHIALVYDGSQPELSRTKLYIDGVLDKTAPDSSSAIAPFTSDLLVGLLKNGGDTFIGRIDEVAMWTRALSPAEVQTLYAGPVGGH